MILISHDVQGAQGQPGSTPAEDAAWAAVFGVLGQGDKGAAAAAVVDLHPYFRVVRHMPAERDMLVAMFADYSWWHFQGNPDPVTVPPVPAAVRLGEITAPTLVLIGELDTPTLHFMADLTVQGIPGAQKVVMARLDHVPFLAAPVAFHRIVLAFLAEH